jgi:hypothetical protein
MWIKEPLLHFIVLGALVFALYGYVGRDGPADDEIAVTRGQQQRIITAFTRTWQRPPTQEEFTNLVDDWIREEIAYREGQTMGLDTDDTIIRRRLRQKLELLAEDVVSMAEPTTDDLQQYLEVNQADYVAEPVYTLRQVYFSPDERGADVLRDAEQALVLLRSGDALVNPEEVGDALSLPHRFVNERQTALAARLGGEFAEGLRDIDAGRWDGPVMSGFGYHLVYIEEFSPGRPLTLEEVEREIKRDWSNRQRIRTIDTMYERLRERYTVTVEPMAEAAGT